MQKFKLANRFYMEIANECCSEITREQGNPCAVLSCLDDQNGDSSKATCNRPTALLDSPKSNEISAIESDDNKFLGIEVLGTESVDTCSTIPSVSNNGEYNYNVLNSKQYSSLKTFEMLTVY